MLKRSVTYQTQRYDVVLVKEDDGGYSASVPDVPGAYSDGDTEAEVLENIADAIADLKESAEEAASILLAHKLAGKPSAGVPAQPPNMDTGAD